MAAKIKMANLALMLEHIHGDTVYIYDEFCPDGALHVEAIRT